MKEVIQADSFLLDRAVKYDEWLNKGLISFSSKIIPVSESLRGEKWVLPSEQAAEILRNAKSLALQKCVCRDHYKRCDNPVEVCLLLNKVGEKFVSKGKARKISFLDATDVLKTANERGLVHLTLYMPNHPVFALCSCCSCCCHDLQIVKLLNRRELMVRSGYVAVTDARICIQCGECVARCMFGARALRDGELQYDADACLGCGLCVAGCPVEATVMQPRKSDVVSQQFINE